MAKRNATSEFVAGIPCASRSLKGEVLEGLIAMIEGDDQASLRSRFRTGSLAVLDANSVLSVLRRAPLRYAGYSGMRLLQRSAAVTTVDLSANPDAVNLAKQAANPRYFPRVRALRVRGVGFSREAGEAFLASLPPGVEILDLSFARLAPGMSLRALSVALASSVRSLSLHGTSSPLGAASFSLPKRLRALDLGGCRFVRLAPILERCAGLRVLRLAFASLTVNAAAEEAPGRAAETGSGWRSGQASSRSAAAGSVRGVQLGTEGGGGARSTSAGAWSVRAAAGGGSGRSVSASEAGSAAGAAALEALAVSPGSLSLRLLDLQGGEVTGPEPLLRLSTALGASLRVLDLRHAAVDKAADATHCFRALWPCAPALVGLGLPSGLSAALTAEGLLRALKPLGRLRWLAATVASLHVGSLPRERAMAAAQGVAAAATGTPSAPPGPEGFTSSLSAPWCSLRALDLVISGWAPSLAAGDTMTPSEAAAAAAAGPRPGSRSVQDMGPLLAAVPQLTRLRVAGSGSPGTRGALVWARGLSQYARVLASGWRGLGETAGAGSRVPSLRKERSLAVLRQVLSASPLRELCVEGSPGLHPRLLLLAAALPRLAHLRLQPVRPGAGSALSEALSAGDARSAVRRQATERGGLARAATGGGRFAGADDSSDDDASDEDADGAVLASPALGRGAGRAAAWPSEADWEALSRVAAPAMGGPSEASPHDLEPFRCPGRSQLPGQAGLDAGGAAAAAEEAEARWLVESGRAAADEALARHRLEAAADATGAAAAAAGPEEDDSGDESGSDAPPAALAHPTAVDAPAPMTGPSVSDLWALSEDSSDDDAPSGGLPTLREPAGDGESAGESSDEEGFGAFGARVLASAASAGASKSKGRQRRARRRPKPAPGGAPSSPAAEGTAALDEADGAAAVAPADSGSLPLRVLGFPRLRQLTVSGWAGLGSRFAEAVGRFAPPSLRRVDCRGTMVTGAGAAALAAAISARERAGYQAWVAAAADEPYRGAGSGGDDVSAVLPGAVSSAWGPTSAFGAGHDEAEAWAMRAPSEWEAEEEAGMRVDAEAAEWVADHAGAEAGEDGDGGAATRSWATEDDALAATVPPVSARPAACATAVRVAAGPWAMHMQGGAAVDALEARGVMAPCQLECVVDAMGEAMV